jgi:hypothetical protein
VDAKFADNPDLAAAWAKQYGGNVDYGKRAYLKALLAQSIGSVSR